MKQTIMLALVTGLVLAGASEARAQSCTGSAVAVQILGSGGPAIKSERASASYLLWVDGQAKMLVDMGGGAFLRFGQSPALSGFAASSVIGDLTIHVYVPEELRAAERDRVKKESARLEKGIIGARGKLANASQVESALVLAGEKLSGA